MPLPHQLARVPPGPPRSFGNPSRRRLHEFVSRAATDTAPGALVLDAGAGDLPYANLWQHVRYESADVARVHGHQTDLTYVCDLSDIPVEPERFDVVVLTQVLEHLPDPGSVLVELHRVMKPGGRLWLTTPLFFEEHEQPYDFHRYTQFGLRHHLERSGFRVVELEWLEGFFGTLGYQAKTAARYIPRRPAAYGDGPGRFALAAGATVFTVAAVGAAALFNGLELRYKITGAGYPKNYAVVAERE